MFKKTALFLFPLLMAMPLPAEDVRATLPDALLDGLIAEALARSPEVAGATAQAAAARERIAPARTLPDPYLSFNYQNDGTAFSLGERDMTFLGAMFSQPLPWPGKLRLAGEEATRRAEEVETSRIGRARLTIEARVRRAWVEQLLARDLLDLIEDRGRAWREISAIVRDRYAVGLGVQQDVLRAQVEVIRVDEARADETARMAARRIELNRLLGRAPETRVPEAHLEFRDAVPDLAALIPAVRTRNPELAGAARGIEAGRVRVSLAKKDFLPDFVASGGPMYRGALDPMWQVGVGITLPVFSGSRQRPRLLAAQSDLRAEESRASAADLDLELRTRERMENLRAAITVGRLYRDGVLPLDQLSLESAVASYRTGKVPFVTVLEALNTLYADRAIYLTRLAEAERWRVSIDEADLQPAGGMSAGATPSGPSPGAGMTNAGSAMGSPAPMR